MKQLLAKYGAAIGFIIRFLVVYVLLTIGYNAYLHSFTTGPDGVTTLVANQSEWLLTTLGYKVTMVAEVAQPFYKVLVQGQYVAQIIEGCNSVSVLLLFVTFIIAFKGSIKHTIWFAITGAVFLYVVNLVRIAILTVAVYKLPQYTNMLHSLVFPAIIYGAMFLLWVVWVKRFAR